MTDYSPTAANGPHAPLWMERVGVRSYRAHNPKGGEINIGFGPGEFTPGELFKLALAGCNATSSDATLAHALGEDYAATVGISGVYDEETDRYVSFQVEVVADMSDLDENAQQRLKDRVKKAIDKRCTIGHSIHHPIEHSTEITSEG